MGGCRALVGEPAPFAGKLAALFVLLCFSVPYFAHFLTKYPILQYLWSVITLLLSGATFFGPLLDDLLLPMFAAALVVPAAYVVPQIIIPIIVVSAGIATSFVLFNRGLTSTRGVFTKICYYTSYFLMVYELSIFVRSIVMIEKLSAREIGIILGSLLIAGVLVFIIAVFGGRAYNADDRGARNGVSKLSFWCVAQK